MYAPRSPLPVDSVLDDLRQILRTSNTAVLQAPPGSGKTTRVPSALLESSWLKGQSILMLEPRRLAASNAARYMASLHNEDVGQTIGYAIRYERRVSAATRIEVITEGLLTRRLQADPELNGIGLVIFDEFHERSLHADLALAFCRDVQRGLRDDLRILVMSATLDTDALVQLLDGCPVVTAAGRSYPTTIRYVQADDAATVSETVARGVRQAVEETTGDVLAFLPGASEIRRCREFLAGLDSRITIHSLYGNLPFAEQEAAIRPGSRRKIVLSTNIAETSLTIEGVETVVDSGWERRPRYDAAAGMLSLDTVRISRASADQRAGRAGRLGPGYCYRLWGEGTQGALLPFTPPEMLLADLVPLAFALAAWGVEDPRQLSWLDPPPAGHLTGARQRLIELGAIDGAGVLTAIGRQMARYPAHPRLARLLLEAEAIAQIGLGCDLVAILEGRELMSRSSLWTHEASSSDLCDRLEWLNRDKSDRTAPARRTAKAWRKRLSAGSDTVAEPDAVGRLLAVAYPDRIARQRQSGGKDYLLRNGQGARLSARSAVQNAAWLVAVEVVRQPNGEQVIHQASALDSELVETLFGDQSDWQREIAWDDSGERFRIREVRRLGALLLQERPVTATSADTLPALLELVRRQGLARLAWTEAARQLRARVMLMARCRSEEAWPDWTDQALLTTLESWLAPALMTARQPADLQRIDLLAPLKNQLGWQRLRDLDRLAPERLAVPSGSSIRLDYTAGDVPVLPVKLQEMFGLAETPRIADGRIPVLVHLLSPANRPLAVTRDLPNFWETVYPEVRKEMKGRYPKHPWPDDPWRAEATARTKPRNR